MALIFLIRHGENEYTRTGKLAGWTKGVSLNEAGQKQAQALVERLKPVPIKAIYSSPLEQMALMGTGFRDRKSTRLNSSHNGQSRMPSSA